MIGTLGRSSALQASLVRFVSAAAMSMILGLSSIARNEDGTLGLIRTPNDGQPVMVAPGRSFEVVALQESELHLVGGGEPISLDSDWQAITGGRVAAQVQLPPGVSPGFYGLSARRDGQDDISLRAVYVLGESPDTYTVAHIASPRIHTGVDMARFEETARSLNPEAALFAGVTGPLTLSGAQDEYRALLAWLAGSTIPTVISPGAADLAGDQFHGFFEPRPHVIWTGRDAYLSVAGVLPGFDDDGLGSVDEFEVLRRQMKSGYWQTGISGIGHELFSFRLQMVLFVDIPLHYVIESGGEQTQSVPWDSFQGPTRVLRAPSSDALQIRWLDVTKRAITVRQLPGAETE